MTVIFSDGRFGSISNTSLFQNITCESNPNAGLLSDCQVIDTCQSRCPNAIGLRCYGKIEQNKELLDLLLYCLNRVW